MQGQALEQPASGRLAEGTLRVEFIEAASWSNEAREGVEMRFRISLPAAAFRSINHLARYGFHVGAGDGIFAPGDPNWSEDIEYRCPVLGCKTKRTLEHVKTSDPPRCKKHNKLLVEQRPKQPPG